jgi:hypothetical protein
VTKSLKLAYLMLVLRQVRSVFAHSSKIATRFALGIYCLALEKMFTKSATFAGVGMTYAAVRLVGVQNQQD